MTLAGTDRWDAPTSPPLVMSPRVPVAPSGAPTTAGPSPGLNGGRGGLVALAMLGAFAFAVVAFSFASRPAGARTDELSRSEMVELVARAEISTVRVAARACPGVVRGSGFIVDGLLFTSGHLVTNDDQLKVDRPGQPVFTPVLARSGSVDVAVARAEGLIAIELSASAATAPEGERVLLAGFPDGGDFEAVGARVVRYESAAAWGVQGTKVMLISPGIRPGFSGGPVLNRDGDVVGMLAGVDETTGLAVAIPGDELGVVMDIAARTWAGETDGSLTHAARPCNG